MLELIISTAQNDPRVRAVMLNGSKANPFANHDIFEDFDIVYLVTELESYKANANWIDCFGQRMVLQCPDDFGDQASKDSYTYLMQFMDGQRLDLTLKIGQFNADSLSLLLLDKDNLVPALAPPSLADYLPQPPSNQTFFECCNEFWWVCPYVAKGLWRKEMIYAQHHLEILRQQLLQMLTWQIGAKTNFMLPLGKLGKHLPNYLMLEQQQQFLQTYSNAEFTQAWRALRALTKLFRSAALEVASHFRLEYPFQDDAKVSAYLKHVQGLPRDATSIY